MRNEQILSAPKPEKTTVSMIGDHSLHWEMHTVDEVGIRIVAVTDELTGVMLTTYPAASEHGSEAGTAWAATMHSRAPYDTLTIHQQVAAAGVDPDRKLTQLKEIGHTSPSEMADIQVNLDRIPIHLAHYLFHIIRTHKGQEKSTRFQTEFEHSPLHPLSQYLPPELAGQAEILAEANAQYQQLGELALHNFAEHRSTVAVGLRRRFVPQGATQEKAFEARTLDNSRGALVAGQLTGLSYKTSARDWARIIGYLKASPIPAYAHIGFVLEELLAPNDEVARELEYVAQAPNLIRHTDAATMNRDNVGELYLFLTESTDLLERVPVSLEFRGAVGQGVELIKKKYSASVRMVAQYILMLHPGMNSNQLMEWLDALPDETKRIISDRIFEGSEFRSEIFDMASTTDMTFIVDCSLGIARDWNRHRGGGGRFSPLPTLYGMPMTYRRALEVLSLGYVVPVQIDELDEMSDVKNQYIADMNDYYARLYKFLGSMREQFREGEDDIDYGFIINLLPLAHKMPIWMHVNPKQTDYIATLRSRNGGQIDYRLHTFEMAKLAAESDLFLSGLQLPEDSRPDAASVEQFFDRS